MNTLYEALKQISTLPTEPARDIALKALREYKPPPRREWVGLTSKCIEELSNKYNIDGWLDSPFEEYVQGLRDADAKLKELNHGH